MHIGKLFVSELDRHFVLVIYQQGFFLQCSDTVDRESGRAYGP